ncbi:hypothetical protein ACIA5A_26565 [Micromonospora sp. NPDC051300]|uniref:hypothetical protein n=1 Tax=Micromonospora sp. NPDC051300 TaxID=3364286 RepID=UPI00378D170A
MSIDRVALSRGTTVSGPCPAGAVREWSWLVTAAGVRSLLRHTVDGTAGAARAGLTIRGFAPAVLLYLPVARWALRRLVRR